MSKFKLEFSDVVLVILGFAIISAFSNCAKADYHLIELDNVDIVYDKFFGNGYTPLLPQYHTLSSGLDLNVDTTVANYFFFKNKINSLTDQTQFRLIGWEFKVGMRLFDWLEGSYHHHSQHQLDIPNSTQLIGEKYPVQDSIQLKFILFKTRDNRESLF